MKLYTVDIYQESGQGGHYSKKITEGLTERSATEKAREWLKQDKMCADWIKRWGSKGSGTPDSWAPGPYNVGYSCGPYYIQITSRSIT